MVDSALSGPPRLDGQLAFVTGALGGIGRATVAALAEAGVSRVADLVGTLRGGES